MVENILTDFVHANPALRVACLRYFNPVGAHSSGLIGEDPLGIPNNLMPYLGQVALGKLPSLNVYGNDYPTPDGTGLRDYIHVEDLAEGHCLALHYLDTHAGVLTVNLGTERPHSVLEVIAAFERASGITVPYEFVGRRAGDLAEYFANAQLAKRRLGWVAQYDLDRMCQDTWRFYQRSRDSVS
jgi:UDP-glucose 4-epimerase